MDAIEREAGNGEALYLQGSAGPGTALGLMEGGFRRQKS